MKKIIAHFLPYQGDVFAHCDIPCGIYSTEAAKTAAKTVYVMVQKIQEAQGNAHDIVRYVSMKEKHAALCKEELLILWTDFFQEKHLTHTPDIHNVVWRAVKLCSQNKRSADLDVAQQLCDAVDEIDEMFRTANKHS